MIQDPAALALASLAILLAAIMQRATGMGGGLVAAPLLALIDIRLVPGALIFGSLALSSLMTLSGRGHIRFTGMRQIAAGIVLGSIAGAVLIHALPSRHFGPAFGVMILAAVLLSASGLRIPDRPIPLLVTGVVSGIMGTTAAIGAPPLALIYQHEHGRTIRATLACLFLISSIVMLVLLNRVGRFGRFEMLNGLLLMPAFVLGNFAARGIAAWVDGGYARPAVLLLSTASALTVIFKNI